MCDDLDEQVIMPTQSPHLQIESDEHYTYVIFNGERIPFLERDLTLLPFATSPLKNSPTIFSATLIEREEIKYWTYKTWCFGVRLARVSGPAQAGRRTRPSSQRPAA